jgi:DedD protein
MNTPTDDTLDLLKRRARRRVLGSVILALAAAICLPLVFERAPPPLPDDVDVKIPTIEGSKFVPKDNAKTVAKQVAQAPAPVVEKEAPPLVIAPSAPVVAPVVVAPKTPAKQALDETPSGLVAGVFVVQVIAVKTEATANEVLEKTREAGYKNAYREIIDVQGGKVTRVRIGPFPNKSAAEKLLPKLASLGYQPNIVELK